MKHLSTLFVLIIFAFALTVLGDDKPADKDAGNELEAKQQKWKEKLEAAKKTGKLELLLPNVKEPMSFIYILPGKYSIGLAQEQRDFLVAQSTEPMIAHNIPTIRIIELIDGFFILDREVTKQQWEALSKKQPSTSTVPVSGVSWIQCSKYCQAFSNHLRLNIRLPSEIEWECAARNGDERILSWTKDYKSFFETKKEEKKKNSAVKLDIKKAVDKTPLNIFDLFENVSEWCFDEYRNQLFDFIEASDENSSIGYIPSTLPSYFIEEGRSLFLKETSTSSKARTYRGGSFRDKPYNRLIPIRRSLMENEKNSVIGFRIMIPCDAWNWQPPKKEEEKTSAAPQDLKKLQDAIKSRKKGQ